MNPSNYSIGFTFHLIEHFGFTIPVVRKEKSEAISLTDFKGWKYDASKWDWENEVTDQVLMNYTPTSQLIDMCNDIDLEMEKAFYSTNCFN